MVILMSVQISYEQKSDPSPVYNHVIVLLVQ